MTSDPNMCKRRAEGMRNSEFYVKQKKIFGKRLNNDSDIIIRRLKAIANSEKHKLSARKQAIKLNTPEIKAKSIKKMKETWAKEETKEKYSYKDKNPNWKDGISFEPYSYEFNDKTKKLVYEKYGKKCYHPDSPAGCKGILSIHHINYNKKDSTINNLIPLCVKHNSEANGKRDYWNKCYSNVIISLEYHR